MHLRRRFVAASGVVAAALLAVGGPASAKTPAEGQPCRRSEVGKVVTVARGRLVCARGVGRVDTWLRLAPTTARSLAPQPTTVEPQTTSGLVLHPLVSRALPTQPVCLALVSWLGGKVAGEVSLVKGSPEACVAFVDTTRTTPSPVSRAPKFDLQIRFVGVPQPRFADGSKWQFPGADPSESGFIEVTPDLHRVGDSALVWASRDGAVLLRQFDDGTLLRVRGASDVVKAIGAAAKPGPTESLRR